MRNSIARQLFSWQKTGGKRIFLALFIITLIFFNACSQQEASPPKAASTWESLGIMELPLKAKNRTMHRYGGWYCPDNVIGLPAINIQELDKVPVVNGRLPTKKETMNGTSLMFFDTAHVDARALDIRLPKVARFYNAISLKNELVIIIQAAAVEKDTLVGFRYLNGGNGTARIDEVSFLSEEEVEKLGATPFVTAKIPVEASAHKVWEIITSPDYAKTLGAEFDQNAFVESDWKEQSKVYFKYAPDRIVSTGIATVVWEDIYIQVDYNLEGYHYVEKYLIQENELTSGVELHVVAGPYGKDYTAQKVVWNNWLEKVKELSE